MDGVRNSSFRERFTELLESSAKSRTAIADEFHVAKQTISAWATGQSSPRLPVASALADYFDVNLGWLLGYDVPKYVDKEKQERYQDNLSKVLSNSDRLGIIFDEEADLIESYRSLSSRGQELLIERSEELKLLYGKKSEGDAAQSV